MHTALHTTDQLAVANREVATRHHDAAQRRATRHGRTTGRTSRTVGAFLAMVVGASLVAGPSAASDGFDPYTGGDKQLQGLVDGWFDPTAPSTAPTWPVGRVR